MTISFTKFTLAVALFTGALLPLFSKQTPETSTIPNFLVILVDDQGFDDLGYYNPTYLKTPNIDQLAKESVRFTDFHNQPVCSPTRACLLTGRHFWRTGVTITQGGWDFVNLNEKHISDVLKENGYINGMWGKWHTGKMDGYLPWDRGFDEGYQAKLYQYENNTGRLNDKPVSHKKYSMEVIADYAINFIEKNKDRPFFAYLPMLTCHAKYVKIDPYFDKYKKMGVSDVMAKLYGTIEMMDLNLGRVFQKVKDLGLDENTIIMYMSDNGPNLTNGDEPLSKEDWTIRNPSQMRGNKSTTWDNGVTSPCFIRWKGHFKPRDVDTLADVVDIFPTMLDFAGIKYENKKKPLDGLSLRPLLEEIKSKWPKRFTFCTTQEVKIKDKGTKWNPFPDNYRNLIEYEDQNIVVRDGRFKLIMNPRAKTKLPFTPEPKLVNKFVLVDTDNDPKEETNVINEHPEVVREMKSAMKKWFDSVTKEENFGVRPVALIGHKGKDSSVVLAYCPNRIGGKVVNKSHVLQNFTAKGDFAEYKLDVVKPGKWHITLNHQTPELTDREIIVSIGKTKVIIKVKDKKAIDAGTFSLTKGKHILRLEGASRGGGKGVIIKKLKSILFKRGKSI